MKISQFEDLGDYECRLAANAVVLVIGGYQISIAKYLRGVSTHSWHSIIDEFRVSKLRYREVDTKIWKILHLK